MGNVPKRSSLEARLHELVAAGVIAWSGERLRPVSPPARTRGTRTVADLLLEDREAGDAPPAQGV